MCSKGWWRLLWCLLLFLVVGIITPSMTMAQDAEELFGVLTPDEQVLVLELIDEGTQAYDQGEFQVALEHFEETYRLFPHPDVLYRLALCHERLGNDDEAIQHYRLFLSAVPDAKERGRVERTIALLEERLGSPMGDLQVATSPAGAAVSILSPRPKELGESPVQVSLSPGTYEIAIEKEGFEPVVEQISIVRGKTVVLHKDIAPLKIEEQPAVRSRTFWEPTLSLLLVGVGVAAALQASEADGAKQKEQSEYDRWYVNERPKMTRDDGEVMEADYEAKIRGHEMTKIAMAVTSGVSFAGAAVLLGWWLLRSDEDSSSVALSINPSPEGATIGVMGRF